MASRRAPGLVEAIWAALAARKGYLRLIRETQR
jgi:hypothetical protein